MTIDQPLNNYFELKLNLHAISISINQSTEMKEIFVNDFEIRITFNECDVCIYNMISFSNHGNFSHGITHNKLVLQVL